MHGGLLARGRWRQDDAPSEFPEQPEAALERGRAVPRDLCRRFPLVFADRRFWDLLSFGINILDEEVRRFPQPAHQDLARALRPDGARLVCERWRFRLKGGDAAAIMPRRPSAMSPAWCEVPTERARVLAFAGWIVRDPAAPAVWRPTEKVHQEQPIRLIDPLETEAFQWWACLHYLTKKELLDRYRPVGGVIKSAAPNFFDPEKTVSKPAHP